MKVEIKIDAGCKEPTVIVVTDKMTDEVRNVVERLSAEVPQIIMGFKDDAAEILDQSDISRICTESGGVLAVTGKGEYRLRLRLYELEERLDRRSFVRISNSEIVNLKKVKRFDLSLSGTICVEMQNGTVTYVSRRYVSKIKKVLGI